MKFKVISLGCPKNLVESEYLIHKLESVGHVNTDECDAVIINTCAFISDAVRESIATILSEAKDNNKIIVTGCMVERYKDKLPDLLPEVDLFVGRNYYNEIEKIIEKKGFFYKKGIFSDTFPRKILTRTPTAYLKILEGCNNKCSYCMVPDIRGPVICKPIEDIKREFLWLIEKGYREINIIGQDIGSYGLGTGADLTTLLKELLMIPGDYYIRLMYIHPKHIDVKLMNLIKGDERIIKYLDMPIQHSEDRILSAMNRGYTKAYLESLLETIKEKIPECTIRTTVIVGFPKETEDDFNALCEFIKKWKFDNLGAFIYSKEEGTPAYKLKGHIKKQTKTKRFSILMELQKSISKENLKKMIGKDCLVIIEEKTKDMAIGRLIMQAPDIDGIAFIKGECEPGEIKPCKIIKTLDYDVIVRV
ncbi:MAG TPA: 30S ribosomal protein S12 methylthiotransferase RimO [Syntrophorhabdaceae bacterium]|nr:30S ribosomal protein S12 methylthiotransferase RimO [Syntrophorhabdaceae bacterium]